MSMIVVRDAFALCEYAQPELFRQDEGGGFAEQDGVIAAMPAVAEKGYLDVHVQVNTLGGHSSVPPPHTVRREEVHVLVANHALGHWYPRCAPHRSREAPYGAQADAR